MKVLASSLVLIVSVVFFGYSPSASVAAEYPEKPITIIVPYGAGSSTDFQARTLADAAKKHLRQPFIIINRPGAGGAIGVMEVIRANPDGYTLGNVSNSVILMPHVQDTGFKSWSDFQPIIASNDVPLAFTVNAKSSWKTLDEFIAAAKASPGKLTVAVASYGIPYLDMVLLTEAAGIQVNFVITSGDADTAAQLLGGHIDAGLPSTAPLVGHVKAGTLKLLAVTTDKRSVVFPDVPTFPELGYKNVPVMYQSMFGPKGIPEPVLKVLHDSFKKALEDETYQTLMTNQCFTIHHRSTADLTKQMAADDKLFGDLVKRLKLKQ